jgi:hypothetical protein
MRATASNMLLSKNDENSNTKKPPKSTRKSGAYMGAGGRCQHSLANFRTGEAPVQGLRFDLLFNAYDITNALLKTGSLQS